MKYIILSDCHLSKRFDERKFIFLKKTISSADRVIINGDLWEGFNATFEEFLNSPWKSLFPLFKKKKAVYLFGNHDLKEYGNNQANEFSVKQDYSFKFQSGNKVFIVEHGNRILPFLDYMLFERSPAFLVNPLEALERFLVRLFGKTFLRIAYKRFNTKIKRLLQGKYKNNEYLVFGHTHFAEVDLENHFINTGFVKHGIGQYVVIEDGNISLKEERY